jgi:hypothetical protein
MLLLLQLPSVVHAVVLVVCIVHATLYLSLYGHVARTLH